MRYCKLCGKGRLTAEIRWGVLHDTETLTPVTSTPFRYALWTCPECGMVRCDGELGEAAEVRKLFAREKRFSYFRSGRPLVVCEDCGIACETDMILRPRPESPCSSDRLFRLRWRCVKCNRLYYEYFALDEVPYSDIAVRPDD